MLFNFVLCMLVFFLQGWLPVQGIQINTVSEHKKRIVYSWNRGTNKFMSYILLTGTETRLCLWGRVGMISNKSPYLIVNCLWPLFPSLYCHDSAPFVFVRIEQEPRCSSFHNIHDNDWNIWRVSPSVCSKTALYTSFPFLSFLL